MMYKKILVPHAGSPAGDKALEHATKIAKDNNSKLTILHVVENIPIPPSLTFSFERKELAKDLRHARSELKKEMHKRLDSKTKKLREQGISTNVKVIHGYPDEEIARIINDEKYDLVVMAKRKKLPGIKAILKLGSISRKILEKISCPILLIDGERK
ncbi:MAG: universal stress protein [Nitrosopumilus sp.]|uniref:universal stress protein n=1 Tax=Nitrosopumilus sp. TaxID=2024843 RepID=UPI002930F9F2|nr:universal stress protein [Nitrosopumilus sp.]